jgi:hypothetical protein
MFELDFADPRDATFPEPETEEPTIEEMRAWMHDGVAEATDGCDIEPDGVCEHGHPSWLIRLGLI